MAEPQASPVHLLSGARILCPATGRDEIGDVLVENGVIADIGPGLERRQGAIPVLRCDGHLLIPGLIDMQVFTGEPGSEHRETLATASRAAAAGGVTTIICMPDTIPVIDDVAIVNFIERAARATAIVNIHPIAAATKRLEGKEMTEIALLKEAGAVAFSNGKTSIADARLMRLLLAYAKDQGALVIHATEDRDLARGGVMNEGNVSTRLGLPGVHSAAETIMVERDVRLAGLTGGRYHAATISCRASLEVIARAKAAGHAVTCGVSVNNLALSEEAIGSYRTYFKVKPPLRAEEDRRAMVTGIASGHIDVIVSNHDPQDVDVKRLPFEEAAYGAIGVETMLAAALELHHRGEIALAPLIAAMTANPARLLGLPGGRLAPGAPADFALVHLDAPWTVDAKRLHSKSKNTLFDEQTFRSRVLRTFVGGVCVYKDPEFHLAYAA